MTAINIRVTPERATVWADGLQYKPDGTIVGVKHKVVRLDGWQAVIVFTGLSYVGDRLAKELPDMASSFDDFRSRRDLILGGTMSALQRVLDKSSQRKFAAFIVGWSDELGAPELIVYNDQAGVGDGRIYTTTEMICPGLTQDDQDAILVEMQTKGVKGRPAVRDLVLAVMQSQRRKRANPKFNSSNAHFVGGHVTETVVDAGGISERVVHRWNDKIGQKIVPDALFPANVAPLVGLSRQERRRAEKLARKGVAA